MQLFFLLASFSVALPAPTPAIAEIAKAHTNPLEFLAIHAPQNLAKCFVFAHTPFGQNPGGCGAGAATKRDLALSADYSGPAGNNAAIKQGYQMTLDMLKQFPGNAELLKAVQDYKTTWPDVFAAPTAPAPTA